MENWESPLVTGNFTQQAKAQMNTDFSSNMPTYHNTHERYRYREPRKMADPVDSYPGQRCVPAKSELSEPIEPYSFDNDVPDNPSWSTSPTPRPNTFIAQTTPPDTTTAEQRVDDKKDGVRALETQKRHHKRRKSSTFIYRADTEDKEQRRIRHIVKNLEIFENQQKMYGRQQLKAIKDGVA
ncbi:hypothetical protein GGI42DRAFT_310658 [Trichoderma sp. SZMC 28013]